MTDFVLVRKGIRGALVVATACALAALSWFAYRALWLASAARDLCAQGFPPSYAEPLARLKFTHRSWQFEPQRVDDLAWQEVVRRELTPSWNLVNLSSWAPGPWAVYKSANYTPYIGKEAKAYDSGAWYQAGESAIAYFLDPRNFLFEREIFMFETLGYDATSQTPEAVARTLAGTFMAEAGYDGGSNTFASLVTDVGRRLGVSPVFLAGRMASEQGKGSVQAHGTIGDALVAYATNSLDRLGGCDVWGARFTRTNENTRVAVARGAAAYNGYYNFFNFRAYGRGLFEIKYNAWVEATCEETRQKYLGPWNTQARAIEGGALKVKERYVDTHRHTRYLQKFSVLAEAGPFRWKQYMQNIAAPLKEARATAAAYAAEGALDRPFRFLIPVYRDMPAEHAPDPAEGRSVYSRPR